MIKYYILTGQYKCKDDQVSYYEKLFSSEKQALDTVKNLEELLDVSWLWCELISCRELNRKILREVQIKIE